MSQNGSHVIRTPEARLILMGGDLRQYSVSNSIMKNLQFSFLNIRTEIEPTEENLRIKNRN